MKKSAPTHLSKEARSWYTRIRDEYGIDDAGGLLLLQTAGESFDRMRQAGEAVKQHGVVVLDRYDQVKSNPAVAAERDARSQMLMAIRQLSLDMEPPGGS